MVLMVDCHVVTPCNNNTVRPSVTLDCFNFRNDREVNVILSYLFMSIRKRTDNLLIDWGLAQRLTKAFQVVKKVYNKN